MKSNGTSPPRKAAATEDPVKAITESYDVEHGQVELSDPENFGLPIKHGYIITSRRAA